MIPVNSSTTLILKRPRDTPAEKLSRHGAARDSIKNDEVTKKRTLLKYRFYYFDVL